MILLKASPKRSGGQEALTLIEILVATALLVMITVGLLAMFNQTQKAFRSSLTSVDVLEGGRTVLDIVTSDLEQLVPSGQPGETNVLAALQSDVAPAINTVSRTGGTISTNYYLQNLFVLTRGVDWTAIGYKVLHPSELNPASADNTNGVVVGSLYRFSTNGARLPGNQFLRTFNSRPRDLMNNDSGRQLSRIIDGVVHFRVHFYDARGRLYYTNTAFNSSALIQDDYHGQKKAAFRGDTVPGYIELELGILEPTAVDQVRAIPEMNEKGRRDFISTNANKVHFYRRQIPIRTALK